MDSLLHLEHAIRLTSLPSTGDKKAVEVLHSNATQIVLEFDMRTERLRGQKLLRSNRRSFSMTAARKDRNSPASSACKPRFLIDINALKNFAQSERVVCMRTIGTVAKLA